MSGAVSAEAAPESRQWKSCSATFDGKVLEIGNAVLSSSWQVGAGVVTPADGALWKEAGLRPVEAEPAGEWQWTVTFSDRQDLPVESHALIADLTGQLGRKTAHYRFRVFENVAAVEWCRLATPGAEVPPDSVIAAFHTLPETKTGFTDVHLQDHTDRYGKNDNLVKVTNHALDGTAFQVAANIAHLGAGQRGLTFVKMAPLPHARAVKTDHDFSWDGKTLTWSGPGVNVVSGQGYPCAVVAYQDGRAGRIAALQDYYRCLRGYQPGRDGLLLSNTWGDHNRDAKIGEEFLKEEVRAGKALGVDVMEIDDGWQKGTTQNSATVTRSKAGVWSGFWRTDPEFWSAHPKRLPKGLKPVADAAKQRGLHLGLWYAPDSEDEFANWQRDADRILELHREHGADYFKLDSITMTTPQAEWNVHRLLDRVIAQSDGKIVVDLDVTAGVRPGYLGAVSCGTVFVENRYTDTKSYWPHQTLRNFWSLAEFVDPVRLRMEFLNNTLNVQKYQGDLAPAAYPPSYLFASVMFGSPLAWMEVSELPEAYAKELAALVAVWRDHRATIHGGHIIPIGAEPDGRQWTGFASIAPDRRSGYLLVLRETNDLPTWEMKLPLMDGRKIKVERLAGEGEATVTATGLSVSLPHSRQFILLRVEPVAN